MAYADGELDSPTMRAVEQAMAEDEALAERVAIFADTRQLARLALAPALNTPVPQALQNHVEALLAAASTGRIEPGPTVETVATKPAQNTGRRAAPSNDNAPRRWMELGMAASVALVLGFGSASLLRAPSQAPAPVEVAVTPPLAPQIGMAAL
ncbi:MAG: hypothetical protein HC794_10110, partial [Nitrospiraceae bacterium]|nr:hypothetical protein [Nitrospiraceae bacterium]